MLYEQVRYCWLVLGRAMGGGCGELPYHTVSLHVTFVCITKIRNSLMGISTIICWYECRRVVPQEEGGRSKEDSGVSRETES